MPPNSKPPPHFFLASKRRSTSTCIYTQSTQVTQGVAGSTANNKTRLTAGVIDSLSIAGASIWFENWRDSRSGFGNGVAGPTSSTKGGA